MGDRWLGWWFGDRLGYGDGRVPEVGGVLEVPRGRPLRPCCYGLHASKHALDALKYRGGTAWRVELIGEREDGDDKSCAYVRRHIGFVPDTDAVLREFARYCAIDVLHLWEPPRVVIDWLHTGGEGLRSAVYDAADAAADDAADDAAYHAAYAAAYAAADDAARAADDAARAAADAAADDAAYAADDAARADYDAAYAAARAAVAAAARADYDAARAKQVERLDRMLMLAGIEAARVAEQEGQPTPPADTPEPASD